MSSVGIMPSFVFTPSIITLKLAELLRLLSMSTSLSVTSRTCSRWETVHFSPQPGMASNLVVLPRVSKQRVCRIGGKYKPLFVPFYGALSC